MSATFEVKPAPPAPAPREAVKTARKIPRTSRRTAAGRSLRRHWQLYLLMVVPLAGSSVFKYIPMSNAVIAFKNYSVIKGIWGSAVGRAGRTSSCSSTTRCSGPW